MVKRWQGGVIEDNSFGTHDFLNLCEELGAEPYLAANVGSSAVEEFTEYVQYFGHEAGHNSTYTFNGKDYIFFHAYDAKDKGIPKLKIVELAWML